MESNKSFATRIYGFMAAVPGMNASVANLARAFPHIRVVQSAAFRMSRANCSVSDTSTKIATLVGGARLVVSFEEHLFRLAYFFGSHEPELSKLLLRISRPGQKWIDIGANIGVFTVTLAKSVGASGSVLAFEPNQRLANRLLESIRINGFKNVELRQNALGESVGEALLHIPVATEEIPGGSGRASLLVQDSLGEVNIERIALSTLDHETKDLGEVFGVKMDVEGFELAVLKGGREFFTDHPPRVVIFEVSLLPEALASPTELLAMVGSYGYDLFTLPDLRAVDLRTEYKGGFCENVLGIHRSELSTRSILGIGQDNEK